MGKLAKPICLRTCKLDWLNEINRVNVFTGPEQEKIMMTGLHKVCDISCK